MGYADQEHCRFSAVRYPDGDWQAPTTGCPTVQIIRDAHQPGTPVTGFAVQDPAGNWITTGRAELPVG